MSTKTQTCPACMEEIDSYAVRCPYCTSKIITTYSTSGEGSIGAFLYGLWCGGLVGAVIGFFFGHWLAGAIILGTVCGLLYYKKGIDSESTHAE